MAYVDFEPTESVPNFDAQRSPARSEYGVLPEIIRQWPGAVRSLNPGASIVAVGAKAEWLCADHPLSYGYGPRSPFGKLIDCGGKVLPLGSDHNNVTLLHYAEHCAKLPPKRIIRRVYKVRSVNGVAAVEVEEFDTSEPVVSAMPETREDGARLWVISGFPPTSASSPRRRMR